MTIRGFLATVLIAAVHPSHSSPIFKNQTGIDLDTPGKPPWPAPWPAGTFRLIEMPTTSQTRCTESRSRITCSHSSIEFEIRGQTRTVHYQRPAQGAPKGTIIIFHGWNLYADFGWEAKSTGRDTYGIYNKVLTIKALLEAGYTVITPNAQKPAGYWDTNQAPYNTKDLRKWTESPDHDLVLALLAAIGEGRFGKSTMDSIHVVGFSSGGYMASRMAYSYPGQFRSITVQSASYFYCGGEYCPASVAKALASLYGTHPPTLFLHGTSDSLVPVETSELYHNALKAHNIDTRRITGRNVNHQWLDEAPKEVLAWIEAH